jgi:hypothetical protein
MTKELWVPARPGMKSHDSNPAVSLEQKLNTIKQKRSIKVVPDLTRRNPSGFKDLYRARLPYTKGVSFLLEPESAEITLVDLDLGDKQLYGHGIGTRLLQRVVDYGSRKRPDIPTVSRGVGNWALVMTLGKVLGGTEYVEFEKGNRMYGAWTGHHPAERALTDYPPEEGEEYNVKNIVGYIDRERLLSAQAAIDGITTTI